jgi:hypothetical protein
MPGWSITRARLIIPLAPKAFGDDLAFAALHPWNVTLARVLSDRAWFRATCPNASFRNGQQAVKDAKTACSIMIWKDEHMIDTLAVAYAEIGGFNSAVQYASQALAVKGISPDSTKRFQQHLALFEQRKPIRS